MKLVVLFLLPFIFVSQAYAAKNFSAQCDAGPVYPGYDDCQSAGPGEVMEAYDYAVECALKEAKSKCLIAGYQTCTYLTERNLGMVSVNSNGYATWNCRAEVYVRGQ